MAQAVGEQGYSATTVADVIRLAGVSRKAFYVHFLNREECFLAVCDMVIEAELEEIADASRSGAATQPDTQDAIAVLFEQAMADPPLIRLVLVEIGALGLEGAARRERRLLAHEQLLRSAIGLAPARKAERSPLLRALVGGVNEILYEQIVHFREPNIAALVPEMAAWVDSYRSIPPAILAAPGRAERPLRVGGRAPGTLSPTPRAGKRRGLRGENVGSHSFVVHSQRERVLDAVANLSASKGYAAVSVKEIAEQAAVSLDAFYEHFAGKEDAFVVAYALGHSRALALTEFAYHSAPSWGEGVRAAIATLFDFLSSEPAFARLALIEALVATSRTSSRAREGIAAFTHILEPGLEQGGESAGWQELAVKAVRGGIAELCLTYAMQERLETICDAVTPTTYFALAPFLGAKEAARIACAGRMRGRGRET
jgi:AcrR family transcriptional regulator